jgi:hypothetical protein
MIVAFCRQFASQTNLLLHKNNEANVQNIRYWAQETPRVNIPTRTQYPQKIHIWAEIFNNI